MSRLDSPTPMFASRPLETLETLKRIPAKMSSTPSSAKRARLSHGPMTPHPSSDDMDPSTSLKLSAVPLRVSDGPMTPSTSTVAFSSSPRQMISSSSPTRQARPTVHKTIDQDITLAHGTTVIFGRHRHSSQSTSTTTLSSSIPSHLGHLLSAPDNDATVVHLSRHASHASRVHAAVELVQGTAEDVVRIVVVGQNGMRVRVAGKKRGVRLVQGQRYDLVLQEGEAGELDFFGCKALVRARTPEPVRERLFSSSPIVQPRLDPASSMPPSSPPMMGLDFDDELSEEEPRRRAVSLSRSSPEPSSTHISATPRDLFDDRASRQSSPLSPPSDAGSMPLPDLDLEEDMGDHRDELLTPESSPVQLPREIQDSAHDAELSRAIKAERIEAVHAPIPSRAASPVLPVPDEVDLPAIIASTVVFSGSSKLSLPDLVKHMLEAQPSLKEHGPESTWSKWVHATLEAYPMFGKVDRHGKDASGHPLLPHYYYNPAEDLDHSRAKELGALVRPLRTAQRTGGKTIDWRPVGRGRRS
ncbi:hypothetical protein IAU60_006292 [Kwoniella sp. DSM 27419]